MANEHMSETVKHVQDGNDLYTLFVVPYGDHWISVVTYADMSARAHSHLGRWLHQPKHARTAEEAWKDAEAVLAQHRKG